MGNYVPVINPTCLLWNRGIAPAKARPANEVLGEFLAEVLATEEQQAVEDGGAEEAAAAEAKEEQEQMELR